jgi:hypothetical protein
MDLAFKIIKENIRTNLFEEKTHSNTFFRSHVQTIPNHGSWAAYKVAELYEKSLDFKDLKITDLGIEKRDFNSNDGPIGGLRWLYGRDIKFDNSWNKIWNTFGENLSKCWNVDIGKIETCLCKFHKQKSGKYYIGHDIHEFLELEHLFNHSEFSEIMSEFDKQIWVESSGVEKKLKTVFRDSFEIINYEYSKIMPSVDIREIILKDKIFSL